MNQSTRMLCAAVVVGAHGVRGQVKVKSFLEDPSDLNAYGPLTDEKGEQSFELDITGSAKGSLICKIDGVTDRNRAEAIKGLKLFIDRDRLPEIAEDDEFYAEDLVGVSVVDSDGNQTGVVNAVFDFGAGDILEVTLSKTGKNELFPFTKEIFPKIDLAGREVTLVQPDVILSQDEDGNVH